MAEVEYAAEFLLVADPAEFPADSAVWGSDRPVPPEEREGRDWLGLARALGWAVEIVPPEAAALRAALAHQRRWVVIGCDPARLDENASATLWNFLAAEPALVIGRAGVADLPWSRLAGAWLEGTAYSGTLLAWRGETPRQWTCPAAFPAARLTPAAGTQTLALLDDHPLAVAIPCGRGRIVTLGCHPSAARSAGAAAIILLRTLLTEAGGFPTAWFDLEGCVALRMDDPGSAQNVHLASWAYRQLDANDWRALLAILATRRARLTVSYVGGWVDDGDAARGTLLVDGQAVARVAGRIHPSAAVVYDDLAGHHPGNCHDYAGQYRALAAAAAGGQVDIALHGYTHMHPDTAAWTAAADRYREVSWFRELGSRADHLAALHGGYDHPVNAGRREIRRRFGTSPAILVCPGHEWSPRTLEVALAAGLQAVCTTAWAFRRGEHFCWVNDLTLTPIDQAATAGLDAGLPAIGYLHDRDVALNGPGWLAACLDDWQAAGAARFITLRDLAAACTSTVNTHFDAGTCRVSLSTGPAAAGVALPVSWHLPASAGCSSLDLAGTPVAGAPRRGRQLLTMT